MKEARRFVTQNVKEFVTLAFILLIYLVAGVLRPEVLSGGRMAGVVNSVLLWTPLNLTMALGMMMVVIMRGIDLSIGSNVALSAMVAGISSATTAARFGRDRCRRGGGRRVGMINGF